MPHKKWELGVGIRPLNFDLDPYQAKYHFKRHWALRFGGGGLTNQKEYNQTYIQPYPPEYSYVVNHKLINRSETYNLFAGIQYSGKLNDEFTWFIGSDILVNYKIRKDSIDLESSRNLTDPFLRPGDILRILSYSDEKSYAYGIRPGIGLQFAITPNFSLSIESSFSYLLRYTEAIDYTNGPAKLLNANGEYEFSFILTTASRANHTKEWGFSPLSFISFNYHF